jgi:2-polyprenyl-6-hydroxyphenyl methylase/3-demethylubiquinone-9 3-methyltransferase
MNADRITFSFGRNWERFLDTLHPKALERMAAYVADWLGSDLSGQSVIDIGSGQGLTSLVAHQAGAHVTSVDVDPASIAATSRLRDTAGQPASWTVRPGSVLDDGFVESLGAFDVVASWGVLHHTGDVWHAIDNAASVVRPGGRLWIALYTRTYAERRSLRTKRWYNRSPDVLKKLWRGGYASAKRIKAALRGDFNPARRYYQERGMDWWRDIEDWLGGLPYEPVGPGEVLARLRPKGFTLERLTDALGEGGNDVYLFRRHAGDSPSSIAVSHRGE